MEEVKVVKEVTEVKDNSLASENFADVAAAYGNVSNFFNFSNFSNSQFAAYGNVSNFSNFSNFSNSPSHLL